MAHAVLLVACPDQRGIVAAVASFVTAYGGNIVDLQQHTDHTDALFFNASSSNSTASRWPGTRSPRRRLR